MIGLAPGISTVSSSFIMTLPEFMGEKDKIFMFADCAVMPNPDAEQLASIAASTTETMKKLVGLQPQVAFLSFSTKGSAEHEDVDKVRQALDIFKKNHPDIPADGEMQHDAAVILMTTNPVRWTPRLKGLYGKPPYDSKSEDGFEAPLLSAYNEALRGLAREMEVPLIDVRAAYPAFAASHNLTIDQLLIDGLHPNDLGHELVAGLLVPAIRNALR